MLHKFRGVPHNLPGETAKGRDVGYRFGKKKVAMKINSSFIGTWLFMMLTYVPFRKSVAMTKDAMDRSSFMLLVKVYLRAAGCLHAATCTPAAGHAEQQDARISSVPELQSAKEEKDEGNSRPFQNRPLRPFD